MPTYLDIQEAVTKRAEKLMLIGYSDLGGVPSWGWGHTGPEVRVGQAITEAQAEHDFQRDQAIADAALKSHVPPGVFATLAEHEKAALLDFVFNAGAGPHGKSEWSIWKVVRAGKLADVPAELNRFVYVHVDGKAVTSRGLKNRRLAEVVLWNTADADTAGSVANAGGNHAASGAVRELPTPPVSDAPKAYARTSLAVKIGTLTSAAGAWASQAIPQLRDHASSLHDMVSSHSDMPYAGPIASTLAAAVVACGVAALFIHDAQQKAAKT